VSLAWPLLIVHASTISGEPHARILLEIGDASGFVSSAHLAAYAGIAPLTHRSGTSIKGEHPARSGNRKLKRAFFLEPPRVRWSLGYVTSTVSAELIRA